ncbi:protein kinase domain-containing protein [Acinetobacter larvae]|uniref:Protein kinase domain-containing protein n=1 Tax=Acinetobacter larvae TaxID=1789224 RepID=A0A1B2M192_9GAMM|nr:protein kinase [Acinetobacter larvae]AOA58945.1 hypothetical protein BFG52_11685 [Acinetobacter larvae]
MMLFDTTPDGYAPRNAPASQALGRRVYRVSIHGQYYWLKLQLKNSNAKAEHSFLYELSLYQHFAAQHLEPCYLPFEIVAVADLNDPNLNKLALHEQGLLLPDSAAHFATNPILLSADQRIHLCLQSLDAVARLHQLGYVHGDLKIQHLRHYAGHCRFIDFEYCFQAGQYQVGHQVEQNQVGQNNLACQHGSPRYMAPELFNGERCSVRSDIYALGIIWLQWLQQQYLYAQDYQAWRHMHQQGIYIDLAVALQDFHALLGLMLTVDPNRRLQDIAQVKQALISILL